MPEARASRAPPVAFSAITNHMLQLPAVRRGATLAEPRRAGYC